MAARAIGLLSLVLLVAAGSLTTAAQQSFVRVRGTGLIVGQVVDAGNGRPISGAIVTLTGTMTAIHSPGSITMAGSVVQPRILTGGDGRFVFRDLPRGSFGISATKPGYADGAHGRRRPAGPTQPLLLTDDERVGDLVVPMWKHAAISGAVVDEAAEPVIGAVIRAYRRSFGSGTRRFVQSSSSTTDDRGIFRLSNLLPGEYVVGTSSRQVAVPLPVADERYPGAGTSPFDTDVSAARLGASDSIQIGDTRFHYLSAGGAVPPPPVGGRFFIYPPTFHPSAAAATEAVAITIASGEDRDGVDLQLRTVRTVRVSGTVSHPAGSAAAIGIRLLPADVERISLEQESPAAVTDSAGAFIFPATPPGQYSLRVAVAPKQIKSGVTPIEPTFWAHMPLTIGESDMTDVTVVLQAGLRVSGNVAFEGITNRPSGAQLRVPLLLEPADGVQTVPVPGLAFSQVDVNGQFAAAPVPAGRYFLRVSGSPVGWMFKGAMHNGVDISETPLDLLADVDGVVLTFTDRWTGMRGSVRTSQGQTDANATVLIFPTDSQRWTGYGSSPRRMRSARTTNAGEFSVTSMPAGDYYAIAVPDERAADWQDTVFLEALSRTATHVTLDEGDQKTLDLRTREVR